jgi:hypothetical protein
MLTKQGEMLNKHSSNFDTERQQLENKYNNLKQDYDTLSFKYDNLRHSRDNQYIKFSEVLSSYHLLLFKISSNLIQADTNNLYTQECSQINNVLKALSTCSSDEEFVATPRRDGNFTNTIVKHPK